MSSRLTKRGGGKAEDMPANYWRNFNTNEGENHGNRN